MTDRPTPLCDAHKFMIENNSFQAGIEVVTSAFARTLERDRAELIEGLERIAWHELTWKEARDLARALLSRLRKEG